MCEVTVPNSLLGVQIGCPQRVNAALQSLRARSKIRRNFQVLGFAVRGHRRVKLVLGQAPQHRVMTDRLSKDLALLWDENIPCTAQLSDLTISKYQQRRALDTITVKAGELNLCARGTTDSR